MILIDSREQHRIDYARKMFDEWGLDYKVKQLPIGDYVCGNTVVEYKTTGDFINSVRDGRLQKEAIDQANNFPNHFVFVVGDIGSTLRYYNKFQRGRVFTRSQFLGAVASLLTYTNVVMFPTIDDAFFCMKKVFEKCNNNSHRIVRPVEKNSNNPAFNFLAGIPGVSGKRAGLICHDLQLESLNDLLKVDKTKLITVDTIGNKTADNIMKAIRGKNYEKGI